MIFEFATRIYILTVLFLLYSTLVVANNSSSTSGSVGLDSSLNDNPDVLDDSQKRLVVEEAQCYSLPYGGWGFFSHILTYYTVLMLCLNKKPLLPWLDLSDSDDKAVKWWNYPVSVLKFFGTHIPALATMIRCNHAWQFEAIAAMKLSLALTSTIVELSSGFEHKSWLALIYFPGAIAGMSGAISLAKFDQTGGMAIVTASFCGAAFLSILGVGIVFAMKSSGKGASEIFGVLGFFVIPLLVFVIFGALYSDWVLAIVINNLAGTPDSDSKLANYLWDAYMVGKRLNLLMI